MMGTKESPAPNVHARAAESSELEQGNSGYGFKNNGVSGDGGLGKHVIHEDREDTGITTASCSSIIP